MASQAAQQGAQPKKVRIKYEEGNGYGELKVYGYPPAGLKKGDKIVFIAEPPGELRLTFNYGSYFTGARTSKTLGVAEPIIGRNPEEILRQNAAFPPDEDSSRDCADDEHRASGTR